MGILLALNFACSEYECKNHSATVHIEETRDGFRLIRNGEPYYIKGGAASPEYLTELSEAGGNTARIYDTLYLRRTLDHAQSLGLAVVVDIPLPKVYIAEEYYENEELFRLIKAGVEPLVRKFHDHPALLYWNLGNELYYPYLYEVSKFHDKFNELIDLVHSIDPNHPVSTTTIGANKSRVLSILSRSPQLDFISFNSFGVLSSFSDKLRPISPIWKGPHVIAEWGVNGPWEARVTEWKAPIEETSTKKAEQIRERYYNYMEPMKGEGSIGSFIFYWGAKNEYTPTWYSLFGKGHQKTQAVFELSQIWKNTNETFPGPVLEYITLNDAGVGKNIVLSPNSLAEAKVILPEERDQALTYEWEIRKESWYDTGISEIETGIDFFTKDQVAKFRTPKEDGPYRLFVYLTNGTEYYATANIPFYVLNPQDEE
ncbi:glycoside hydrolase family 2 TIM barrel-domain containing protein [Pontixanthobacter gangjinensis]|uniref:Glycoside hydrolase family 2 catalytic domain-containing protein n=1 Tax=Christiangramia aestuarii TaxID=1028746 RepID=A0A7M3SYF7_9FLAO|nr:hypothetical protein [Christiangramia aestuarii]MUP41638.1 hypothetical protein [Christiangramia aestuarii]